MSNLYILAFAAAMLGAGWLIECVADFSGLVFGSYVGYEFAARTKNKVGTDAK